MKNYSLNGLRMFEAAARHLSFSASADELNVSQAAVSQQIRRLEEQLGTKLFSREKGRVALTADGKELAGASGSAFFRINRAIAKITKSQIDAALTISTVSSFATKWLIPRIQDFHSSHPTIRLSVHTSEHKVDFATSGIDAAIRLGAKDDYGLCVEPLFKDMMCLVATPELSAKIGSDFEKLYEHPLLVDGSPNLSENLPDLTSVATRKAIEALGLNTERINVVSHCSSATVVLSALAGKGVGLTRFSLSMDDIASGKLEAILNFSLSTDIEYSMVYPREKMNSENLAAFRYWLRHELAKSPSIWNVAV